MRASCPAHIIVIVYITLTILVKDQKLRRFPFYDFLNPPVPFLPLGPHILKHSQSLGSLRVRDQLSSIFVL
jgi:hypothetical protein